LPPTSAILKKCVRRAKKEFEKTLGFSVVVGDCIYASVKVFDIPIVSLYANYEEKDKYELKASWVDFVVEKKQINTFKILYERRFREKFVISNSKPMNSLAEGSVTKGVASLNPFKSFPISSGHDFIFGKTEPISSSEESSRSNDTPNFGDSSNHPLNDDHIIELLKLDESSIQKGSSDPNSFDQDK
jgi:hypothetical protein